MFAKSILLGLKRKIGEPIMILLTVAIAVATFVSALALRDSVERTAIASYRALSGTSDLEITAKEDYASYYLTADGSAFREIEEQVAPFGTLHKGYRFYASFGKEGGSGRFASVYATDYAELSGYNPVRFVKGRSPSAQTEIVLSESYAKKLGVKAGDYLVASRYGSDKSHTLVVAGIAEEEGVFSEVNVLISEVAAARLLDQVDEVRVYNRIFVELSEEKMILAGVTAAQAADAIREALPSYRVESPVKDRNVEITLTYQSILLFMIAIIVAVLGAVLIYTAVTLVMKNRVSLAAQFKSVGATSGALSLYLLAEILLYGLIGSLIGLAGSYAVSAIFGALTGSVSGFSVGAGAAFAGIGFGVLLSLLSSLLPVLRLAYSPLQEMLRFRSPLSKAKVLPVVVTAPIFLALFLGAAFAGVSSAFTVGVLAAIALLSLLFAAMPLAVKGSSVLVRRCAKDRPRMGNLYLAASGARTNRHTQSGARLLAIAITAVVAVAVLLGESNSQLSSFERLFRADIMITANDAELSEIASEAKKEKGVSGAYLCYIENRCVLTGEEGNTVTLIAARAGEFEQAFRAKEYGVDVDAIRGKRKLALGGGLAMKLGLEIGDQVEIEVKGKPTVFTIACLIDSPLTVVFTDLSGLSDVVSANTCLVKGDDGAYTRLSQKYALKGAVYYVSDAFGYVTDLAKSYIKVFTLFEFLVLLFAVAGYLNTALAAHRDRKREYELLAASGASKGDLRTIVTAENAIVVCTAAAIGALCSVGLLFIVQNMLKSLGLYFTLLG